jgi:hypothetical protein
MNITLGSGSKCAVLLPQKIVNAQITPAKGLIINRSLSMKSVVLIEEVWQFKGLETSPLSEMCLSPGKIREANWGWQEIPAILNKINEYLLVEVFAHDIFPLTPSVLDEMISKSIAEFLTIHRSRS